MYLQWGYGSGGFLKYIPFPTTSIILKKSEKKTWHIYDFIRIF